MVKAKHINSKTALEKISEYWQSLSIIAGIAIASILFMIYAQSYFVLQKDLNASIGNRDLNMQIYIKDEVAKPIKELERSLTELELSMNKLEIKMNLIVDKVIQDLESEKSLAKGVK